MIPEDLLNVKATDLNVGDRCVCIISVENKIYCWNYFHIVKEIESLNRLNLKNEQISVGLYIVCVINSNGLLKCAHNEIGEPDTVVPLGFTIGTLAIKTNIHSNLAVDQNGSLKFWWNKPRYSATQVKDKS